MQHRRFTSLPEQVAEKMREEIGKGSWGVRVPGRDKLVEVMGVSGKTVETALQILQKEGLLESQGPGRRRRIVQRAPLPFPSLKLAILTFDPIAQCEGYLGELRHLLEEAGHGVFFAASSLGELGHNARRVSRLVKQTKADAWVVEAGGQEVLEWFAKNRIPVFALFGRRRSIPIAGIGPEKIPAYMAATDRLVELGHRRIVMLTRAARRLPTPGAPEQAFLDRLQAHGLSPASGYNLPDWEESVGGLNQCLERLFHVTPPTALIVDEAPFFLATLQFCGNLRLRVPEDVSLICTDYDPSFSWFTPSVSHIRWDRRTVIRRIVRWAAKVSRGKEDVRQSFTKAKFIDGGTVGPVNDHPVAAERGRW